MYLHIFGFAFCWENNVNDDIFLVFAQRWLRRSQMTCSSDAKKFMNIIMGTVVPWNAYTYLDGDAYSDANAVAVAVKKFHCRRFIHIFFCVFFLLDFYFHILTAFCGWRQQWDLVSSSRALCYWLCGINYTLCHLDSITNLCKSRFNLFNSHDPSMMAIQVRNKWVGIRIYIVLYYMVKCYLTVMS